MIQLQKIVLMCFFVVSVFAHGDLSQNAFIFVVDTSGSMSTYTKDTKGSSRARYEIATDALNSALRTISNLDSSETNLYPIIPIFKFSNESELVQTIDIQSEWELLSSEQLYPSGGTMTSMGLARADQFAKQTEIQLQTQSFKKIFNQKNSMGIVWNVILITDGENSDGNETFRTLEAMKNSTTVRYKLSVITLDFSSRYEREYSEYAKLYSAKGASELVLSIGKVIAEASGPSSGASESMYDACALKPNQKSVDPEEIKYSSAISASLVADRFKDVRAIAYRATGPESDLSKDLINSCESKSGEPLRLCLYEVCKKHVYGVVTNP